MTDTDQHERSPESDTDDPRAKGGGAGKIPAAEWVTAILGMVLVASTIGFALFRWMRAASLPPDLVVESRPATRVRAGYLVEFRAVNHGGQTAEEVSIEGTLRMPDGSVERSETQIQYVPVRASRSGGLIFAHDPTGLDLQIRAQGYSRP